MEDLDQQFASVMNPPTKGPDLDAAYNETLGTSPVDPVFHALSAKLSPLTGDEHLQGYAQRAAQAANLPDEHRQAFQDELHQRLRVDLLQKNVAQEREALNGTYGNKGTEDYYLERIPVLGSAASATRHADVYEAAKAIQSGNASARQYRAVAKQLAEAEYAHNQDWYEYAADLATSLPKEIVEWMLVSPLVKGPGKLAETGAVAGAEKVGAGATTQAVAGFTANTATRAALRTAIREDKLVGDTYAQMTPNVGTDEHGRLTATGGDAPAVAVRKAAISDFLSNLAFEAAGTYEPKAGGMAPAKIAISTGKAVGAGQVAQEASAYLGGGGEGGVISQLAKAKDWDQRKKILSRFAAEVGVFGLLETGMHGLGKVTPEEAEPGIEQMKVRLAEQGVPEDAWGTFIAKTIADARQKQQEAISPPQGQTPAEPTGKRLPTPDELTAALEGKDVTPPAQEKPTGGVPTPEPGTGLINPVQTGVPGIVSGAKEIPARPGDSLTYDEAAAMAKSLGLKATGSRTVLLERLRQHPGEKVLGQMEDALRGKTPAEPPKQPAERRGPNRPPQGVWEAIKAEHPDWSIEQIGREAARQADELKVDKLTGFLNGQVGTARQDATEQAIAHVERNDGPATYAEIDLANLGGLNAHAGHEGANKHYRAFADIIKAELDQLNPTLFRHGGDEMSAVVHAPQAEVDAAMARAQAKALEYAKANGLDTIPHPKNSPKTPRPSGTGIHYGTSDVRAGDKPADVYSRADRALEERKVQAHVNRTQAEAAGVVPPSAPAPTTPPGASEPQAPARPAEPPAAVQPQPLDVLAQRFQEGEHVDFAEVADAAGLNPRERALLDATMEGLTFEQAAKRMGLNSRQRAHQIAGDIAEKLGMDRSLSRTVLDSLRAGAAERGVSREAGGEEVQTEAFQQPVEKMTAEEQGAVKRARRALDEGERIQRQIEKLTNQWLKETENGELAAERTAFFEAESQRLGRALTQAQARGAPARSADKGIAGEPGAGEPTPVRPEGQQLREGPATPEVPPPGPGGTTGGSAEAPSGTAETPGGAQVERGAAAPSATERGKAGGDELSPITKFWAKTLHDNVDRLDWPVFLKRKGLGADAVKQILSEMDKTFPITQPGQEGRGVRIPEPEHVRGSLLKDYLGSRGAKDWVSPFKNPPNAEILSDKVDAKTGVRTISYADPVLGTVREESRLIPEATEAQERALVKHLQLTAEGDKLGIPAEHLSSAQEAGVDPIAMRDDARHIIEQDRAAVKERNAFLKEVRDQLPEKVRKLITTERYEDSASVPGLDEVADYWEKRRPDLVKPGEKFIDTLFDLLKTGRRRLMRPEVAYDQALLRLIGEKENAALQEAATVPAPLREEAVRNAQADAQSEVAAEGGAGPAPTGESFDFGHNVSGEPIGAEPTYRGPEPTGGQRGIEPSPATDKLAQDSALGMASDFLFDPTATVFINPAKIQAKVAEIYGNIKHEAALVWDELLKIGGKMLPATHRLNRPTGEALTRMAAAHVYVRAAVPEMIDRVAGKDMTPEQDRLAGAVMSERRLRTIKDAFTDDLADAWQAYQQARTTNDPDTIAKARKALGDAKNKRDAVKSLIGIADASGNVALPDEKAYQDALNSPFMKGVFQRWKDNMVPFMDENYKKAFWMEQSDPILAKTQIPGEPMNLKHVEDRGDVSPTTVFTSAQGNLKNVQLRKLVFGEQATGSADAYDTSLAAIIANSFQRSYELATKHHAAKTAIEAGNAMMANQGKQVVLPSGAKGKEIPFVKSRQGQSLYVDEATYPEWRQALAVDEPFKIPGVTPLLQALTKANVGLSTIELAYHARNLFTAMGAPGQIPFADVLRNGYKLLRGNPEVARTLVDLAQIGAAKEPGFETASIFPNDLRNPLTWTSKALDFIDKAVRLSVNDGFDRMKRLGYDVQDTEANRRDFINQWTGQYNTRGQSKIIKFLRESGFGPFATAGTTYATRGLKALAFEPSVKMNTWQSAVAVRAEMMGKAAAVFGAVALWNYLLWKRWDGDDATPWGAIKIGTTDDGRTKYLNVADWVSGIPRGTRTSGLNAVIEGQRRDLPGNVTAKKGLEDVVRSIIHPAIGPGSQFLDTAATGKDSFGRDIATAKGQEPTPWNNLWAAIKNLNPGVAALMGEGRPGEEMSWSERGMKLAGPYGVKYRTDPAIGDFYEAYKQADAEHRDFTQKRKAGLAVPTYTQAKFGEYQRLQWTEQRMVKLNEAMRAAKTDEQKAEIRRQQALLARQALRR